MPFCTTGQEFWPEYNINIFAPKLVERIFSGPRKKWKILQKEKKKKVKFYTKMPLVPTGQEFRPKCNVAIFS